MPYSDDFYKDAQYYNRKKKLPLPAIYGPNPGPETRAYVDVVATFQGGAELKVDGKLGPGTLTAMRDAILDDGEPKVLTYDDLVDLAHFTSPFEGDFDSCNRDGEYRGLFDRPPEKYHWASKNNPKNADSGGTHVGLSYGYIQFTQDGGMLGKLLDKMFVADSGLFALCFGEHFPTLLDVTNRKGKKRKNGRSPRVQKVGGHDLWQSYWVDRFREAASHEVFQRCQIEMAVDNYMIPALKNCDKLGLKSARSIVIVFDRGVQYGPGGAYNKLLKPTREGTASEHAFLRKFMHKYDERRWGHRVEKLWQNPDLYDGPCDWTEVLEAA